MADVGSSTTPALLKTFVTIGVNASVMAATIPATFRSTTGLFFFGSSGSSPCCVKTAAIPVKRQKTPVKVTSFMAIPAMKEVNPKQSSL